MNWSEEVHSSRYGTAIARATAERRLRKRGLQVPVLETSQVGPLMAMAAVASGLVAWQRWGAPVRAALAQNPMVQQFRTLILGTSASAPRPIATNKSTNKSSGGSKATARKPAVVTPTPAQAAAAAAESRLAATASAQASTSTRVVPPVPSRPAQTEPQPQASTSGPGPASSSASGAGSSSSSSKKKGKKRR